MGCYGGLVSSTLEPGVPSLLAGLFGVQSLVFIGSSESSGKPSSSLLSSKEARILSGCSGGLASLGVPSIMNCLRGGPSLLFIGST
jgi:hypothetical protein